MDPRNAREGGQAGLRLRGMGTLGAGALTLYTYIEESSNIRWRADLLWILTIKARYSTPVAAK